MCVTNALYGALGVMAASQCTMNNFTFGNDTHQYYETISGGSGAGPGFHGTSVVQTHMTNSRLTDPEVLEFRFPVRLDSYAIRAGSGGAGAGAAAMAACAACASWSDDRVHPEQRPPRAGLRHGRRAAGALGMNRVERADGTRRALGHIGSARWPGRRVRDRDTGRRRLRQAGPHPGHRLRALWR
jgi:5-oxoprolinase (ATP-hydrolysing)